MSSKKPDWPEWVLRPCTVSTSQTGHSEVRKQMYHEISKKSLMSSLRNKKTTCQSSLSVKVYNPTRTYIERHAKHSFSHSCHIELHHFHNQPLQSAHTLSFKPVAPDTQEAFHGYFKAGHSAASARSMHEFMLLQEDEFEIKLADRAYNPSLQDVNHLLQQWRLLEMGPPNGDLFE